jgi:hypothetical protein
MADASSGSRTTKYPGDIGAGILLDLFRMTRDEDQRPWLRLIDGDASGGPTLTLTRSLFVVHAPGNCSGAGDPIACARRATPWSRLRRWRAVDLPAPTRSDVVALQRDAAA